MDGGTRNVGVEGFHVRSLLDHAGKGYNNNRASAQHLDERSMSRVICA